ncbi:MAG: hypothetical protein K9L62_02855 [Vallitaleaceae bacterium]|nr:hypothetical protein [Vallitaleaceae bacterium]
MSKTDYRLQEIIDFFELEGESWGKDEVMREYANEIKELQGNALDEVGLEWDGENLMILDDFVAQYFNKVIEGVCNVIKSFKEEKKEGVNNE